MRRGWGDRASQPLSNHGKAPNMTSSIHFDAHIFINETNPGRNT
jgi:hypothetical protein